jgi:hypothetical protein
MSKSSNKTMNNVIPSLRAGAIRAPKQPAIKTIVLTCAAILMLAGAAHALPPFDDIGPVSGNTTMTGDANTAYGNSALIYNTTGSNNAAYGAGALYFNTNGIENTAIGTYTLNSCQNASYNTVLGAFALQGDTTGNANIAIGYLAGLYLDTGDNNIDIGNQGKSGDSDTIRIGETGTHKATYIAGINGVTVPNASNPVVVDSVTGQLGTVDVNTLVGPQGSQGPQGATGPQGLQGSQGLAGVGLVTGAYLFLPPSQPAPAGFTKVAVWSEPMRNLSGKYIVFTMNVYQKN